MVPVTKAARLTARGPGAWALELSMHLALSSVIDSLMITSGISSAIWWMSWITPRAERLPPQTETTLTSKGLTSQASSRNRRPPGVAGRAAQGRVWQHRMGRGAHLQTAHHPVMDGGGVC